MLAEHTFRVVIVGKGHGVGVGESELAEKTVEYTGEKLVVKP
jgi:hypothetical protein